jgi:hypothetical protein
MVRFGEERRREGEEREREGEEMESEALEAMASGSADGRERDGGRRTEGVERREREGLEREREGEEISRSKSERRVMLVDRRVRLFEVRVRLCEVRVRSGELTVAFRGRERSEVRRARRGVERLAPRGERVMLVALQVSWVLRSDVRCRGEELDVSVYGSSGVASHPVRSEREELENVAEDCGGVSGGGEYRGGELCVQCQTQAPRRSRPAWSRPKGTQTSPHRRARRVRRCTPRRTCFRTTPPGRTPPRSTRAWSSRPGWLSGAAAAGRC